MTRWPKVLEEAYCYSSMLCAVGFSSDDLFLELEGTRVYLTLHVGGSTKPRDTFRLHCGDHTMTSGILIELWTKFCSEVASGRVTDDELKAIRARSIAPTQALDLALALERRGIPYVAAK